MRSTIIFLAALAASTATLRAETVVVSTTAVGGTTFYDSRTPRTPNSYLFGNGPILENYEVRGGTTARSNVGFTVPAAPAGGVLKSSTLNIHLAWTQVAVTFPSLTVDVPTQGWINLVGLFDAPSTRIGATGRLDDVGGPSNYVDVVVAVDITAYMRSILDQQAHSLNFLLGGDGGLVDVWGAFTGAMSPTLVSTFEVVPEPSSLVMAGTALVVGMMVIRRRIA